LTLIQIASIDVGIHIQDIVPGQKTSARKGCRRVHRLLDLLNTAHCYVQHPCCVRAAMLARTTYNAEYAALVY
jgi:hypothetical protein